MRARLEHTDGHARVEENQRIWLRNARAVSCWCALSGDSEDEERRANSAFIVVSET